MAGHLRIRVVAEGIETEKQWRRINEMACGAAQGYWFGQPLTSEDVSAQLL
jgi:EAL domain-containing protein (putative c-di-GMP-specific phosphodiesterase class I)